MQAGRYGVRGLGLLAVALVASLGATACGNDGGPITPPLDLSEIEGLYAIQSLVFDPQGSAPAADILSAFEAQGTAPTLNIGRTGSFQLFYRDPVSANVETIEGTVQALGDGIRLMFPSQTQADVFLFPQALPLLYDADGGTLSYEGTAEVSRGRLMSLFPGLYDNEQLYDPTPGTLTVSFVRSAEGA